MEQLIEGYRRFREETWPGERARYEALAKRGQRPETMVIACSDSRVDPQTVFGAVPGELFVVRNVAGLVPPYQPDSGYHGTSAALEFAVRVLKVSRIVVLGHAQCGGVQALVEGIPPEAGDFVGPWMALARDALDRQSNEAETDSIHYEMAVIRLSLAALQTFPWIRDAAAEGRLEIFGFRFDIHTGTLMQLDEAGFRWIE